MSNSIALSVDTQSLVHTLKHSFSRPESLVTELAQNARRAKASAIAFRNIDGGIEIEDDGAGMEDLQSLLNVARSGWDQQTIDDEGSYGLGFLIALHSAQKITVESAGGTFTADTADILSFKPAAIAQQRRERGTKITLTGGSIKPLTMQALSRLFAGFPIEVILDGESVPRPSALDDSFQAFSAGHARLGAERRATDHGLTQSLGVRTYLQGLPVQTAAYSTMPIVIHLDAALFRGKAPDRDQLCNPDLASASIVRAINEYLRRHLESLLEAKQYKSLFDAESTVKALGMTEIYNQIPLIPYRWLVAADSPALLDLAQGWTPSIGGAARLIRRSALLDASMLIPHAAVRGWAADIHHDPESVAAVNIVTYARRHVGSMFVETDLLPNGHWLLAMPNYNPAPLIRVSHVAPAPNNPDPGVHDRYGNQRDVIFAEAATLSGPLGEVRVTDGQAYQLLEAGPGELSASLIITRHACAEEIANSLQDWRKDADDEEGLAESLWSWMSVAFANDTSQLILDAIRASPAYDALQAAMAGKRFTLSFDQYGNTQLEAA